ncbi:integrase, catalytic region, zinc finger, CCHC-type containing protein [Tanacetum coccineum]
MEIATNSLTSPYVTYSGATFSCDKYKKVLDEIWKDKVELDGMIVKEEEEAIKKVKGEALKEKDNPRAFIFPIKLEGKVNENALADTGSDINTMPYRIYEQLGKEEIKKVDRGIIMINHTQAEAMGILINILCQVGVTTIIAKFLILDIPIDRDAPIVVGRGFIYTIGGIVNTPERLFSTFDGICHQTFRAARSDVLITTKSDSDDEEEYEIKRNKFRAPVYGPKAAAYLNCNDPAERSLALQAVINPFRKISVWKKAVSFLGSLPAPLKHVNWKPDYKCCYTNKEEAKGQWRTEIRVTDPYGNIFVQGFTTKKTDRKISKYHKMSDIMSPNWFIELWEETMLKPDHQDPNALDNIKSRKKYCFHKFIMNSYYRKVTTMRRSLAFNIKEPINLELCHKFYSTYEFDEVCADDELQTKKIIKFRLGERAHSLTLLEFAHRLGLYHNLMRRDLMCIFKEEPNFEGDSQDDHLWLVKARVLSDVVIKSLSTLIYCRDLDTTTLRELIDSEGRLILEDLQPGVPRVGIRRPPRASMHDLYERIGNMEIRQGAIERMSYRQSYHWDKYVRVFEHMAGVYSVDLQGAYNPHGYAQP